MTWFDTTPADRRFLGSVLLFCAIAGCLSSLWCIYIDHVINNDGVEYIRAAERFALGDISGAFAIHQWPFFSALMWITAALLGISYENAGYLLNTAFFTASSVVFVLVVHAFGGRSRRLVMLAAFIAVLHPSFNEYRSYIIRDAGYLLFYLLALLFFARRAACPSIWSGVAAVAALALAALFRIEGAVFLIAAPLLLVTSSTVGARQPWRDLVLLIGSTVTVAVVLGWWLLAPKHGMPAGDVADNPIGVVGSALDQVVATLSKKMAILRSEFLGAYSAEYAWALFVFAVGMLLVSATFTQLTIPWAVIVLGSIWFGVKFPLKPLNRLWLSLVGMHLAILLVFTVINLFLAARYPLALAITILILGPFAMDRVFEMTTWRRLRGIPRVLAVVLVLWGIGESVSGLDNATRAEAIKGAGLWLAPQAESPGSVITNDRRIAYYAGRHWDRDSIEPSVSKILHGLRDGHWPEAKFVALRLSRADKKTHDWVVEALGGSPVRTFDYDSGDRVLIYIRP